MSYLANLILGLSSFFSLFLRGSYLSILLIMIMNTMKLRHSLSQMAKNHTLLTGIQPTGDLHIGNYLGSITNMLKLQD